MRVLSVYIPSILSLLLGVDAGLLGAGFGDGSCSAFPFRSEDTDHVGGCPRWAECCSEFGYCHAKENWINGYFRDCNGESNGIPLPGSVIRLEAEQAARGESKVTAQMLGISTEIWQKEVSKAESFISSSSLSSTSSSLSSTSSSSSGSSLTSGLSSSSEISSTGFSGSQTGLAVGEINSSDLVAKIILALQPQIVQAIQGVVKGSSTTSTVFGSGSSSIGQFAQNAGQNINSISTNLQSSSVDTSQIIALIVEQLKPQITAAVNKIV